MSRLGRALAAMAVGSLAIVAGGQSASAGSVCDSTFHKVSGPTGSGSTSLNGVDAVSPADAWAVGDDGANGFSIHWNGSTWQEVAVPVIGTSDYLGAVAMAGSHNI